MSINVIRFRHEGQIRWGTVKQDRVTILDASLPPGDQSLGEWLESGGIERALAPKKQKVPNDPSAAASLRLEDVELLSPLTEPCTIVCQGKNYAEHLQETGTLPQDQPFNLLFGKASSSLTSARGAIVRPPGVELLDYELELGLVLKRPIQGPLELKEKELPDYLAGIVMANDVSARDVQIPEGQWYRGKSFRTFCPAGPFLTLLEPADFARLPELKLSLSVNGEERQSARVSQLLYSPLQTLNLISSVLNLRAGDLILTGTPGGVALKVPHGIFPKLAQAFLSPAKLGQVFVKMQKKSGRYLKDGDLIESRLRTDDGALDLGVQRLRVGS